MTRRIFPSPIFVLGPICGQLGPGEVESRRAEARKSGFEIGLGRRGGRSCHRVVKLLETKASECSKNQSFLPKMHFLSKNAFFVKNGLILEFEFRTRILDSCLLVQLRPYRAAVDGHVIPD